MGLNIKKHCVLANYYTVFKLTNTICPIDRHYVFTWDEQSFMMQLGVYIMCCVVFV